MWAGRLEAGIGWCGVTAAGACVFSLALFNLATGLAFLMFVVLGLLEPARFTRWLREPLVVGAIAFVAFAASSLMWSPAPTAEALGRLDDYRVLLLPLILLPAFGQARWRDRALTVLAALLLGTLVLSLLQPFWDLPFTKSARFNDGLTTQGAIWWDRIRHGTQMNWLLLVALGGLAHAGITRHWQRALLWGLVAAILFDVVWLVQARTGFIASLALVLYMLIRVGAGRVVGWVLLGVAAWIAAGLAGLPVLPERLAVLPAEILMPPADGTEIESPAGVRLALWAQAFSMIATAPFFGHGVASFATFANAAQAAAGLSDWRHGDPHNEFLHVAATLGLTGLGLLIAGLVTLWRTAARFDPGWQWMARGSVVLYVVSASFNDTFAYASAAYFFALLFALIVGRLNESRHRLDDSVSPDRAA